MHFSFSLPTFLCGLALTVSAQSPEPKPNPDPVPKPPIPSTAPPAVKTDLPAAAPVRDAGRKVLSGTGAFGWGRLRV